MFASIRRHQKWLWLLISAAVIVSFVVFFTPDVESHFRAGGTGNTTYGTIAGRPIPIEEAQTALKEARLRYFLYSGTRAFPEDDPSARQFFDEQREIVTRLFVMEKLQELQIQVSDEATAEWISSVFRDERGVFRPEGLKQFVQQSLAPRGISEADLYRFARREVALQHLIAVAGVPGTLVTPQEAELLFRRENEQIHTEAVFFNLSNHLDSVTIDPASLGTYFTNQMARYRIPERLEVAYVRFDPAQHLAEADQRLAGETNLAAAVLSIYQQRGTNAFLDPAGQPLPAAAAHDQIRGEIRHNQSLLIARRFANEFTDALLEAHEKEPQVTDHFDRLAAAKNLPILRTQPFDAFTGPGDASLPETFGRAASSLSADQPYSLPAVGTNGVYVLALKRKIPSEIPSLDSIRDRVSDDYRRSRALELVRAAGADFHAALTNALAQGKTFEALAKERQLDPVKISPLSTTTRTLPEVESHASLSQFRDAIQSLKIGQPSRFIPSRDGGFVAMVLARTPVADAVVKAELPAYAAQLRQQAQYEAFNEWFRQERERTAITVAGSTNNPL